jgi:hypothetical protein
VTGFFFSLRFKTAGGLWSSNSHWSSSINKLIYRSDCMCIRCFFHWKTEMQDLSFIPNGFMKGFSYAILANSGKWMVLICGWSYQNVEAVFKMSLLAVLGGGGVKVIVSWARSGVEAELHWNMKILVEIRISTDCLNPGCGGRARWQ